MSDKSIEYWKYKSLKYKSKYRLLLNQAGGALKPKKTDKKDKGDEKPAKKEKRDHKPKGEDDDRPSVRITCVKVYQKKEDLNFEGSMCKTPPIRIRIEEGEAKWAKVVKILLKYVSKRLRMSEVKKVEVKQGKKVLKLDGDKLGEEFKVENMSEIDEIAIYMG
jgi:hypothetical protein